MWWLFHGDSYNDWHREEVDHVIFLFHVWNDGFWRADHDLPSYSGLNSGLWKSLSSLLDGMEVTYVGDWRLADQPHVVGPEGYTSELFGRDQLFLRVLP